MEGKTRWAHLHIQRHLILMQYTSSSCERRYKHISTDWSMHMLFYDQSVC